MKKQAKTKKAPKKNKKSAQRPATKGRKKVTSKKVKMTSKAQTKPIGVVTHYYGGLGVAIIKFAKPVAVGDSIQIKGATTDLIQKVNSMQFDHKEIEEAKKGQEVGVKVKDRIREGDEVFEA